MTTVKKLLLTLTLIAAFASPAHGYNDVVTHPQLTIVATEKSALYTDGSIMRALGLLPAEQQLFLYGARGNDVRYGTAIYPLSAFVGEGAFDEDVGYRALNHFFDPHFNAPLTYGRELGLRSWDWILEEGGNNPDQNRSAFDARTYLQRALTFNGGDPAFSDDQRGIAFAEMFLSLGHVLHHLQDMTQPQHVRNDLHLDKYPVLGLNPLYDPSRYESYTRDRGPFVQTIAEMASPNYPGTAFSAPRDFWFNGAGTGVAQYVNRNFVSKDTNFTIDGTTINAGTYPLPLPGQATDYTIESLFAASGVPVPQQITTICTPTGPNCTMTMIATAATQKASTRSVFDQDLQLNGRTLTIPANSWWPQITVKRLFALNRFNFDSAHEVLINRAVSYSAGFLNFFFRGKIDVFGPATGPYAVVDHSENKGFSKVKVRLRNATAGQALGGGKLRAIAKFNRNECYTPDLKGEFSIDENGVFQPPQCQGDAVYRSFESHLRMTDEQDISFTDGEMKDMTFTFADPIPLDATDLILQVYYRGAVGPEANGFAIGAADLSEATYVTVMNATDVFELNGQAFYDYDEIIANIAQAPYSIIDRNADQRFTVPPDVDVRGGNIQFEIRINGERVGDISALPEGRFGRIAALVSPFGFTLTLVAFGNGFASATAYNLPAKNFQYDPQQGGIIVSTVGKLRKQALQFNSVSHYHFYPTFGTPVSKMPPSTASDPEVLIPVQMVDPAALTAAPSSLRRAVEESSNVGNAATANEHGKPVKVEKPKKKK